MYVGRDGAAICLPIPSAYNRIVSRVSDLYRLQQIDLEIDKLNVRLDEIESILQDSSETRRLKGELAEAELHLRTLRNAAQSAEHAVVSQRQKISGTEAKLYGGQIQSPKELQDLQAESESLKRHLDTLEDRYLEAMLEQDEAQRIYDGLAAELERTQAERHTTNTELVDEQGRNSQRIRDLEAEREAALATVSDEDLASYESLRERHRGVALARLKDDSCSECGMTLSAATQQTVRSGNELIRCSQCHRLLYGG